MLLDQLNSLRTAQALNYGRAWIELGLTFKSVIKPFLILDEIALTE